MIERLFALILVILFSPVLVPAAICVALESGFPIVFRQVRVGKHGRPFNLLKLRSMRPSRAGCRITAGGDPRVTRVGRVLRRYKLDELPQLWNIVRGEMSFIGPRPELPAFVDLQDPRWIQILQSKPGITDLSTLVYREEESILARHEDTERAYREEVLPAKLALSARYLRQRCLRTDFKLLMLTAKYSFLPAGFDADRILRSLVEEG